MDQQINRIQPVNDNLDKYETYKTNLTKYKLALKGGFLFEALLIDYAMIEDRLRSMLYHMAYFYDSNFNCWKKTKPLFTNIVKSYKEEHESDTFDTNKISGKIKLIRCVIRWAHNTNECYNKKSYHSALKQRCENIDIEETFINLLKWCQYRNEIIHALLNKNVSSVNENLKARVEEGMEIARYLDSQVKHLKKDNLIRKSIGAPLN